MKQIMNAYEGTCKNCHHYSKLVAVNENDTELSVCYRCGELIQKQVFNSRNYIKELIEDGTEREVDIADALSDKLIAIYDCLDTEEIEALAGLLVKELYDEVKFEVVSETEENTEFIREREIARMGTY